MTVTSLTDERSDVLVVRSPYNQNVVGHVRRTLPTDVGAVMSRAARGAQKARESSAAERSHALEMAARAVESRMEGFARTITLETGKTVREARREVARCVNTLRLCADEAKRIRGRTIPFDSFERRGERQGYYTCEPLGIIVAITPFNDPLNLAAHKIGPAIAAGNAVILKPSELSPLSAHALAEELWNAGVSDSVLQVVHGDATLGSALVSDPRPRMISFTGGEQAAAAITKHAGVKKIATELGGNGTVIVMQDCEIESAVEACAAGAFSGAGQNCIGTQRILVQEPIYDLFLQRFAAKTGTLRVGDPLDERTDIGPMITEHHAERIERLVNDAIGHGSAVVCGHLRTGSVYTPTVLTNVPPMEAIWVDELFAPVVCVMPFVRFEEALRTVNEAASTIHVGLFTRDLETALMAAESLDAAGVMINDSSDYRFDGMPFGGFKYGGIGREGVEFSIREMTQTKVVCFKRA